MVYTIGLGPIVARHGGSSPLSPTKLKYFDFVHILSYNVLMSSEARPAKPQTVKSTEIKCPNFRDKICPPSCELYLQVAMGTLRGKNTADLVQKFKNSGTPLALCIRR
jgi:hypothetical protein